METRNKSKFVLLSVILLTCLTSSSLMAQKTARAGVKAGMNVSNLYIDDVHDENARIGFNGGFYGQILSSDVFAIQPELLYSTKGTRADYTGFVVNQKVRFNLNYIDVPVLAVFKLGQSAEIHAGAYGSYLLNANIEYEGNTNGTDELDRDHFKSYDYGLVGGFGLNFNTVQIGARYNFGLVELANSNAARNVLGNSKNSVAQLYLALNLNQD